MIYLHDILSQCPNTRFIAYHNDNSYHYAVGITKDGYDILHIPITALHVAPHIQHIPNMPIHILQRIFFFTDHMVMQMQLYDRYHDVIKQSSLHPTVKPINMTLRWSTLSKAFNVPPERTVMYLGAAAFANKVGNINWACSYQLTWS